MQSWGIQIYTTKSETKAAFADRWIRSLKNILEHLMEDYGYKYIQKLSPFVTTLNCGKNARLTWYQKSQGIRPSVHSVQQATMRILKTQVEDWKQGSLLRVWLTFQEGSYATVYTGNFLKCCRFFQKISDIYKKGWTERDYRLYFLSKKVDQNHSTMESFIIVLVFLLLHSYFQTALWALL